MARTHELGWPRLRVYWPSGGRFAWNFQRLDKHARTYSVARAYEIDEPYRGSRSVVLRLAGTRGMVFHHWEVNPDSLQDDGNERWIQQHLARALSCQKGSQRFQDSVTVDDEDDIHVVVYANPEEADRDEENGSVRIYGGSGPYDPAYTRDDTELESLWMDVW